MTLEELIERAIDGPAVVVLPNRTPHDAIWRFLDNYDVDHAFGVAIVLSCDSQQEASQLSTELESHHVEHLRL